MKPRFRLNRRFCFTGYCRWQSLRSAAAEAEILDFTGGHPTPILTFGSMVYGDASSWMQRLAAHWPSNRKLIIQQGWAGFEAPPRAPHIKILGPMSHDQLFEHASLVIHHGGAGTTASVLHAGRPHIIVPHIADQNFFAHEIRRLGCGIQLRKATWPENLATAVARVEADPSLRLRAAEASRVLHSENGPRTAVEALENYVREGATVDDVLY